MQNKEGVVQDLYIPMKCSSSNMLITAKDHASVQMNIGHLDANGVYTGDCTTFALSGFVRTQGDADSALDRLWQKKNVDFRVVIFYHLFGKQQHVQLATQIVKMILKIDDVISPSEY